MFASRALASAALLHLAGLATASRRSWEVIDLFCSFQSDVESEGVVAQALGGLADALRHGALPELESLTVHCRGEANDWTTKLGRGAPPDVNAALAKLCVALPPYRSRRDVRRRVDARAERAAPGSSPTGPRST